MGSVRISRLCNSAVARLAVLGALAGGVVLAACVLLDAAAMNTVVTREFKWQITHIPNFDVYYYGQGGQNLLPFLQEHLEDAYARSTKVLPVHSDRERRFPFLLFNSHNDFEQTNVTPIGEGVQGVTEAFKNRLLVGNKGSRRQLEYVTAHEFTHEIEYVYLLGEGWRSLNILELIFYPSWMMEGLAEYTSGDLDYVTREMYLRDAALDKKLFTLDELFNFNHVVPHRVVMAYKQSEGLWHYVAREYGEDKLPLILASFKGAFSGDLVLRNVIGTTTAKLDKKFREYLEDSYALASRGLQEPSAYGRKITVSVPYPSFYTAPVFSPLGDTVAYLSDKTGAREVYLMDLVSGKSTRLWNMSRSVRLESIGDDDESNLSFSPDGSILAFVAESQQRDYLCLYDIASGTLRKIDTGAESLSSPAFGNDGKTVYLSALRDGFRNLCAFDLVEGTLTSLTDGPMDHIDAAPSPDGNYLYYAGERRTPGGRIEYDICRLPLGTKEPEFVTSLPGDERYPCVSPDGRKLYFTAEQDGVRDIYRLDLTAGGIERLTRVIGGNFQPKVSPDGGRLLFSSFRHAERHLYLMDIEKSPAITETPGPSPVVFSTKPPARHSGRIPSTYWGPYRFAASTDLFLPFIAYSSLDGLFVSTYWQVSEFLGDHQLSSNINLASGQLFTYQVSYAFLKYRPRVSFNFVGDNYYRDFAQTIRHEENGQSVFASYPLNRFQSVGLGGANLDRADFFTNAPELDRRDTANIISLAFMHDTTQGKYLEITSGCQLGLLTQASGPYWGGNSYYQNYAVEGQYFFPLGREQVLNWRASLATSYGSDAVSFLLAGPQGVRGFPGDFTRYAGRKTFANTLEWRFPLVYNINYHVRFFFPDFFFKAFYGAVFVDTGVAWNEDVELKDMNIDRWIGSYGIALRFHTFVLETVPLLLDLQLVRRFDGPFYTFYFLPGYSLFFSYPF